MNKSALLIWISIAVMLHVKAEDKTDDHNKLCLQCRGENAYPDCPTNETNSILNITIYCRKAGEHFCTIGIVKVTEENSTSDEDLICLIRQAKISLEEISKDQTDFEIISIVEQPMLPMPLLLQTTEEPSLIASNEYNESNIQIISISNKEIDAMRPNISHMSIVVNTNAAASLAEGESNDVEGTADVAEEAAANVEPEKNPEEVSEASNAAAEVELEVVEEAAVETDADKEAEGAKPETEVEKKEKDVPEAEADKKDEAETVATAAESAPEDAASATEQELSSDTASTDYQGDEAKPDAEIDVDAVKGPTVEVASTADVKPFEESTPITLAADSSSGSNEAIPVLMNCYSCTSSSEANCTTNPESKIKCNPLKGSGKNGCYTLVKGNQLQRGCLSDLVTTELSICLKASSTTCQKCYTSDCNYKPWPQCYSCDSSKEPNCAWWRPSLIFQIRRTLCSSQLDQCVTHVDANGVTLRSCSGASTLCSSYSNATCTLCMSNLCNGGVFPSTRRRCFQCTDGATCAQHQRTLTSSYACLIYRHDESCFFYVNDTNQMIRGCTSEATEFQRCQKSTTKCVKCAAADGCNDTPLMVAPKLKCSRCDSRKSTSQADSCAWAQTTETLVSCVNRYPYYLQESCLTIFNAEMEWAVRDCSFDFGACEPTDQWCHSCPTNGCNSGNMKWQYCLQCNSAADPACQAGSIPPQRCAVSMQPFELRGCFTKFNVDTNTTTRGCISELTDEGMKFCKDSAKLCSLCYDQGCNNHMVKSFGSIVDPMNIRTMLGMIFAVITAGFL